MIHDGRQKNVRWRLFDEGTPNNRGGRSYPYNHVFTALLMDIRDELQELNRRLGCPNFMGIPTTLRDIARNTKRRKKKPVTLRKVS